MRTAHLASASILVTVVACRSASAPLPPPRPPVASPHVEAAAPVDDVPLVATEIKTDVELAHALREHYVKYEHRIPMRDGKRLHTVVYVPKDRSHAWPIVLKRTPYSVAPYGVDAYPDGSNPWEVGVAPSKAMLRDGYIFAMQDVRGRMMSEGEFVDMRPRAAKGGTDESTDAFDSIDWLVKNVPSNNGKVGVWGVSYLGYYAAQAAIDAHPALKTAAPAAPNCEWFAGDDAHHNGALFLGNTFDFFASFGKARPKPVKKWPWGFDYESSDAYDFFMELGPLSNVEAKYFKGDIALWKDLAAHPNRDDWWQARDPRPHYKNAKPAIMAIGGWFDAEDLYGTLETYRAYDKQSARTAEVSLVMGPWRHGGWMGSDGDKLGDVSFGAKTSTFFHERIELPFYQRHLKAKVLPPEPEAWIFETGTNMWQRYAAWPPADAKPVTLSFHARGRIDTSAPVAREDAAVDDAYTSDPAKPVPYTDRHSLGIDESYMIGDQRFAARRPDVLVYQTPPLDADVTLAGPIEASLWVTVTGTDADFVVKVVDVYPPEYPDPVPNPTGVRMAGYQQLVRGEVMRGRFRNSFEKPEPFKSGEPTLVRFTLPDVSHTFRAGHRLMVQVQSSWFPLVDRNPQTFVDVFKATESDFRAARHAVLRTPACPSGIKVLVLRGALPGAK